MPIKVKSGLAVTVGIWVSVRSSEGLSTIVGSAVGLGGADAEVVGRTSSVGVDDYEAGAESVGVGAVPVQAL